MTLRPLLYSPASGSAGRLELTQGVLDLPSSCSSFLKQGVNCGGGF